MRRRIVRVGAALTPALCVLASLLIAYLLGYNMGRMAGKADGIRWADRCAFHSDCSDAR